MSQGIVGTRLAPLQKLSHCRRLAESSCHIENKWDMTLFSLFLHGTVIVQSYYVETNRRRKVYLG